MSLGGDRSPITNTIDPARLRSLMSIITGTTPPEHASLQQINDAIIAKAKHITYDPSARSPARPGRSSVGLDDPGMLWEMLRDMAEHNLDNPLAANLVLDAIAAGYDQSTALLTGYYNSPASPNTLSTHEAGLVTIGPDGAVYNPTAEASAPLEITVLRRNSGSPTLPILALLAMGAAAAYPAYRRARHYYSPEQRTERAHAYFGLDGSPSALGRIASGHAIVDKLSYQKTVPLPDAGWSKPFDLDEVLSSRPATYRYRKRLWPLDANNLRFDIDLLPANRLTMLGLLRYLHAAGMPVFEPTTAQFIRFARHARVLRKDSQGQSLAAAKGTVRVRGH